MRKREIDRLKKLKERAINARAMANYWDAIHDLNIWPGLYKKIVDDLENAIKAHEQSKNT